MSIISLLLTLIIWGLIFYVLFWGLGAAGISEPFNKVARVILIVAAVVIVIGLLTGSVHSFPIIQGHI